MTGIITAAYDIIVVGKGISGLTAAMEAASAGARVAVVYSSEFSSTALAYEGVFRLPVNKQELEEKIRSYSHGIAKEEMLHSFSTNYCDIYDQELANIFPLASTKPVGKKHRHGGPGIIADLERVCLSHGVSFINGKAAKVSTANGRISALQVFVFPRLVTIECKTIILATGGGLGNVYKSSDNVVDYCSPGHILALNAGAKLRDMEYVSFHPFGVIDHHTFHNTMPIYTFFNIGVRTKMYGADTDQRLDFIEDLISSRTTEKNAHDNIFQVAREVHKHGGAYFYNKQNQKVNVKAVAHSLIGGIDTNLEYETAVPGLYSVGELTGGLNGAGRMPGMALLEGFVSGAEAAISACKYANRTGREEPDEQDLITTTIRFGMFSKLTNQVNQIADTALFIERDEETMAACYQQLEELISSIGDKTLSEHIERDIAETASIMTQASRMRTESRGFFVRTDFPDSKQEQQQSLIVSRDSVNGKIHIDWERANIEQSTCQ